MRVKPFHGAAMRSFGSEKAIREQGGFLLVMKEYVVRVGTICTIRFNV